MRNSRCAFASLVLVCLVSSALPQSVGRLQIGEALIRSRANPVDDPDAIVADLLHVALAHARSAASELLLAEAQRHASLLRDPASALESVRAFMAAGPHGLGEQVARNLEVLCLARIDPGKAIELDPYRDRATQVLAIGPFGDRGDHYTGVPFPPELDFPGPDKVLAGRFGPLLTRVVRRKRASQTLSLIDPQNRHQGCHYALHRIEAESAISAYLELTCSGSFQVFLNGEEVGRVNRNQHPTPRTRFFPVPLRQGRNHVLVKTTTVGQDRISLRYVDGAGRTLTGIREVSAEEELLGWSDGISPPAGEEFVDGIAALRSGLRDARGEDLATLRVAVALSAFRTGNIDDGLAVLRRLETEPPTAPATWLALAMAIQSATPLPAEFRSGQARRIVEAQGDRLGDHHRLRMERVTLLEDEDRGEEAIRLLQAEVDAGRAGPETFSRLRGLLSRLAFDAELQRLADLWIQAVPADPRPVLLRATARAEGGDKRGALELLRDAIERQPGSALLQRRIVDLARDLAEVELATETLAALHSREPDSLAALEDRADLLRRTGSRERAVAVYETIATHAEAEPDEVHRAADRLYELGEERTAVAGYRRALAAEPSSHSLRRLLARLEGVEDFPLIARFRRDGDAAIAAFQPSERERGSPSTMLLDQLIVQILPDGSIVSETHHLRRINDLRGVERFQNADRAAAASEVVLLRTVSTDGKSYVPNLVEGNFSMPRLEPGAFVELVVRDYQEAPGAGPWRGPLFMFQSNREPYLRSEFVVILPPATRGSFRVRGFSQAAEQIALEDGGEAHVFTRRDMPRLQTERLLPPIEELVPVVTFGEDTDLQAMARQAHAVALRRNHVTPYISEKVAEIIAGLTGDRERVAAIHGFVHQQIPDGGGSTDPTSILLRSQGARFFLEAALLQEAGVPFQHARAAAVRQELRNMPEPFFRGENLYEIPALLVQPRDGEPLWLFAGNPRYTRLGEIPSQRLGAVAILLDEGTFAPTRLPDGDRTGSQGYRLEGAVRLEPGGSASVEADLILRGAVGLSAAEQIRNMEENLREVAARQLITGILQGWTMREVQLVDLQQRGTPLRVRGRLERPRALRPAGDSWLLPLPLLPGNYMASLGDRGGRQLPLSISSSTSATWELAIDPGEGYRFAEVPEPIQVVHDLLEYSLSFRMEGSVLIVRRELHQTPGRVPARRFEEWRTLLGSLDQAEALNLRLVQRQR